MSDQDFDLLSDDWIPCVNSEGKTKAYSIRSALEQSAAIRGIDHESPIVCLSILRLLLAFCYRVAYATGKPLSSFSRWRIVREAWDNGVPATEIDQYIDDCQCRDRFCLFDKKYPFFQVAGLVCQGNKQPEQATRLAFEQFAGTPNSLWEHFAHPPSVAEAALYLVCCQTFGASASNTSDAQVGGLEYSPTGRTFAPAYTGCIVWLEGANLLETLLLNLVDYDMTDRDLPIWEKPLTIHTLRARQPHKAKEGDLDKDGKQIKIGKKISDYKAVVPTGAVQLFTWPSRAVLLSAPDKGKTTTVHFTQGLALSDYTVDPMKPYNHDGKPIGLQRHKAAWRDLHSLLDLQPNQNRTVLALSHAARCGIPSPRLNVAGIARGDKAAKILFWRHERMPVPAALLEDVNLIERLGDLLQRGEHAESELISRVKRACRYYRVPGGREPSKNEWDDINKIAQDIDPRPAYWARLEKHFYDLLENLPKDWDASADDWKPDEQQLATGAWSNAVKQEAQRALEESIRSLGTTARAVAAVAQSFNDDDLKPQQPKPTASKRKAKAARKGGEKK